MPLTTYGVDTILLGVSWTVEVTEEFEAWWDRLHEEERVSVDGMIHVLEAQGPALAPPYSVVVQESRYPELRQLIVPHHAGDVCVLYITDGSRATVVLLTGATGGSPSPCPPGDIETAEEIYARYLAKRQTSH